MGAYMGVPSTPRIIIPAGVTAAAKADSSSAWVRANLLLLLLTFLLVDSSCADFSALPGRPLLRRLSLLFPGGPRDFSCA